MCIECGNLCYPKVNTFLVLTVSANLISGYRGIAAMKLGPSVGNLRAISRVKSPLLFTPTPTAGATSGDDHAVPLQVEGISVGGANNCKVNTSLNNLARIPDELGISDQSQLVLPQRRRPRPTLPCVCVRNVVIFGPRLLSGHVRAVILLALRGA